MRQLPDSLSTVARELSALSAVLALPAAIRSDARVSGTPVMSARLQWLAVRLCLKTIFAALRYLAPYVDRQRDYEQATGKFTPQVSLALDLIDMERHR